MLLSEYLKYSLIFIFTSNDLNVFEFHYLQRQIPT
jgi:hypothetical protein